MAKGAAAVLPWPRCEAKGRKTRRLRLTWEMALALRQFPDECDAGDDDLVFVADRGRRVSSSNLMRRVLKPATARAGIGRFVGKRAERWGGCHTFRHTCATRLSWRSAGSGAGVPRALQLRITRTYYVHLLPDDQPEQRSLRGRKGGNRVATRPAEMGRDGRKVEVAG